MEKPTDAAVAASSAFSVVLDQELVRRLSGAGRCYRCYPPAARFSDGISGRHLRAWLGRRRIGGHARPLAVELHAPTVDPAGGTRPVDRCKRNAKLLAREIDLHGSLLGDSREVKWVHLAGTVPASIGVDQLGDLERSLGEAFDLRPDTRLSVEASASSLSDEVQQSLVSLGFRGITLMAARDGGRSDCDDRLAGDWCAPLDRARANGFQSVAMDVAVPAVGVDADRVHDAFDALLSRRPDRVCLIDERAVAGEGDYCRHAPCARAPDPGIFASTVGQLIDAGYAHVGGQCFAPADADIAVAGRSGRLQFSLLGFDVDAEYDVIGIGPGATSSIGPLYAQNMRSPADHSAALSRRALPVERGVELGRDDLLRRRVIHSLLCHSGISMEAIEHAPLIDFRDYFAKEMERLAELEQLGVIRVHEDWIGIEPRGRLLVGNVCAVFDRYLPDGLPSQETGRA